MRRVIAAWAFLLIGAAIHSFAQEQPRGRVIDKVVCRSDADQSYALYLPAGYSPDRRWPIVYALDPGARGRLPVDRFKEAAESLGFILVGSNNSRNGPLQIADAAVNAMLADTQARFALDPQRAYVTGFSGGARTAVMVGMAMSGRIAGIIGFGAGFPTTIAPRPGTPFVYFGAAGTEDFNYPEFVALDRALEHANVPHRVDVFDGGHEWPPVEVCTRALEWMELQAIRSGRRPKDAALVDAIFQRWTSGAAAEESAGRPHIGFLLYDAMARDFAGLHDVAPCQEKARALARSRGVQESLGELRDSMGTQKRMEEVVQRLIVAALAGEDPFGSTRELLLELRNVKKRGETSKRPAERMAARRTLTSTWIWLQEGVSEDIERRALERAAARLRLMTEVRPENALVEYRLARVLARDGEKKQAIEALRRAVTKGFSDAETLEQEPDLAPLRGEAAFREIVEKIRKGERRD